MPGLGTRAAPYEGSFCMNKYDYVKIAWVIARARPHAGQGPWTTEQDAARARSVWYALRSDMADILADDNPYFTRGRFYTATEVIERLANLIQTRRRVNGMAAERVLATDANTLTED